MNDASFHSSQISRTGTSLARYETPDGSREVLAFNIDDRISVVDSAPFERGVEGFQKRFADPIVIERGVFLWTGSLAALVSDYVAESEKRGGPAVSERVKMEACEELAEILRQEAGRIAA